MNKPYIQQPAVFYLHETISFRKENDLPTNLAQVRWAKEPQSHHSGTQTGK